MVLWPTVFDLTLLERLLYPWELQLSVSLLWLNHKRRHMQKFLQTFHKRLCSKEEGCYLSECNVILECKECLWVDESRTHDGCVLLRRYFFGADPDAMDATEREALLRDTLILSYDLTMRDLLSDGTAIAEDTNRARNELIAQRVSSRA